MHDWRELIQDIESFSAGTYWGYFSCTGCASLDSQFPHVHHTADAVSRLHVRESLVDATQGLPVRDELVHLQLTGQVVVYEVWQLRASLDASESTALPDAACDELECY